MVSQGWGQEAKPDASGPTQEPNRLSIKKNATPSGPVSPYQRLADAIADKLNHCPILSNFRVTVKVREGDVGLTATLWTEAQRAEVIRETESVAGVQQVQDRLQVAVSS